MVMKLNKSIPRVMKENWGQYIGMLYMVILSVFLFVALTITAQNLKYNKDFYIKNNVQEDLEFYALNKIDNISEIEDNFDLVMDETLVKEFSNNDTTIRFFTPNEKVNIPAVMEGKMPLEGEIALDPLFAKANDLKVGDEYHIGNSSYKISGFIGLPNYAYILEKEGDMINNPEFFGIGIMNEEDMQNGMHLYSVKYNNLNKDIYEKAKPLKAYLNENNVAILDWVYAEYNMKISTLNMETMAITAYSTIVPTVILLITVVLISIVLGRNIKNQMPNIGTLYALGYRKKEIKKHYMNYPIILSLYGGVIGGVLGLVAIKPILKLFLSYFPIPIEKFSYYPLYVIIGIIISMAFLYIGSYISINRILKLSPVSLMKNEGKFKKVKPMERRLKLEKFKFKTKFSIREQLRSIPRIIFLVAGVSAATVFLMYGFVAKCSMDYMINQEGNDIFSYTQEYILKEATTSAPPSSGEGVSGMKFVLKQKLSNNFELLGAGKDSKLITLKDRDGNKISIDDNKFIITSMMANKYSLEVGDKVEFVNIIDDKEYYVKITDIAESNTGDYIFTSLDTYDELLGLEKGSYNAILSNQELDINPNDVFISKTPSKISEMLKDYTTLLNSFIFGIAVIAFAIGIIIVYIIASITIDENKNYISLMKVFGYKKKEINSMMLNNGRKYVVLGYIIGVPAGYYLVKMILKIFEAMNLNLEARLDISYVLIGFVIIFLTFEISKALCSKKVEKIA
ncbi:MAG: ABC transporter permease, partial [Peptostreptococcaceae bacterium]